MKPKKYSKPPPPLGHASNGPIGLDCQTGTSWHLPNCAVEYPLSFRVCASGAQVFGRSELYPGAEVASSVMTPMPTVWWLRPDRRAARVGAHSAVVWKRLYLRPFPASRSAVGVEHGPPNALEAAKPTSSRRTTRTFGAPAGGRSGSIGGNVASGSLASRGSSPSYRRSGIGSTSRSIWPVTLDSSPRSRAPWTGSREPCGCAIAQRRARQATGSGDHHTVTPCVRLAARHSPG